MTRKLLLVALYAILIGDSLLETQAYTAAVVEYYPIQNRSLSADEILNGNVAEYIKILSEIQQSLDVIVFPEATITHSSHSSLNLSTEVPSAVENITPCFSDDYPKFFKDLSCAAFTYSTYIVVNLIEKSPCNETLQQLAGDVRPCAPSGYNLYNTDVAFDRNGTVVAKYRKYNLFGEFDKNRTVTPDISYFTTDFNVTFGLFTCFDILFESPALVLTSLNIRDIIFPTMWYSELPFLTAIQAQEMFSEATDVNFLASGANNPSVGSGGSGIYAGRVGPITEGYVARGGSKVFVAEVGANVEKPLETRDVDSDAKQLDGFKLIRDDLGNYTTVSLDLKSGRVQEKVCHLVEERGEEFCCDFDVTLEVMYGIEEASEQFYLYRMAAFSGVRSFSGVYNGGIELCAIISCVNTTLDSCGYRFSNYSSVYWPITIEQATIRANFTNVHTRRQYPNSLLADLRPVERNATDWQSIVYSDDAIVERTILLKEPQNRLFTFGIYGRDFTRDSDPFASSAVRVGFELLVLVVGVMVFIV